MIKLRSGVCVGTGRWARLGRLAALVLLCAGAHGCAATPVIDADRLARAEAGDAEAQYDVAERYYAAARASLIGPRELWDEAEAWYGRAAHQGHGPSQFQLGMYALSRQEYDRSFEWMTRAANQGIAEAQASLGLHHGQAWGTEQDLVLAYKWLALGTHGDMHDPMRNVVDLDWLIRRGNMTPAQIAEGRRLAAEHMARFGRSHSIVKAPLR